MQANNMSWGLIWVIKTVLLMILLFVAFQDTHSQFEDEINFDNFEFMRLFSKRGQRSR